MIYSLCIFPNDLQQVFFCDSGDIFILEGKSVLADIQFVFRFIQCHQDDRVARLVDPRIHHRRYVHGWDWLETMKQI